VASRDQMVAFLRELLQSPGFEDYGPNGLQVPGTETVEVVATGVSANREFFDKAIAAGAHMVVCHHGLFLHSQPRLIDAHLKARLKPLFDNDVSLVAYHLPLDAHPEVGNNALICDKLGLERKEPFGVVRGNHIGWVGECAGFSFEGLRQRCREIFGTDPLAFSSGPELVQRIGVVSGSGASTIAEAEALGVDALLTGEPSEPVMAQAKEAGMHFLAAGHYATEIFGVKRLGELLSERFSIRHVFVDVFNPV
jgi:dinuclear metal center YbgI/SA1388 family protein